MTDISERGIEAALAAKEHPEGYSVATRLTFGKGDPVTCMTAAIQAYLPFHPPASREEGLREAAGLARAQAETFRKAGLARDDVGDYINGGRFNAKGVGAAEVANGIDALIPTKPEAREPDYLVWSNEHRQWWRPDRSGYTTSIHAAGRYPRSEALRLAKSARNGWGAYGNPDEIAVPLADALLCMPHAALQSKKPE